MIEQGHREFVTEIAAELPLQAIAEIMGVPQEERHLLFDWSNRMVGADDPEYNKDPANTLDATMAAAELYMFASGAGTRRREDPRDDVVTKLINAEIDGRQTHLRRVRTLYSATRSRRQRDHKKRNSARNARGHDTP